MEEKKTNGLLSKSNESSRREFMKTAGKLAIFTPPAVMLLTRPSRACITQSPGISRFWDSKNIFSDHDGHDVHGGHGGHRR